VAFQSRKGLGAPFNSIFSWLIKKRVHQIELFKQHPFDVQREMLSELLSSASNTEFGLKHNFSKIGSYDTFKKFVPLQTYEDLNPYVQRLLEGEQNILWPGEITWFAKSSGTTKSKSKLIPVSKQSLNETHYKGGKDLLGIYYSLHPKTKLFNGKHLIVGGSAEINYFNQNSYFGDLSSIIVKNLPWWCEWRRTPSREIALLSEWEEKLERMAKATAKEDVHIIAGVPSWTLVLLNKILKNEGANYIDEVWPNLELYMHGGVNFAPYKKQFESIISKRDMNYVQTYNASEGFFAIQDTARGDDMLLMLDYGIFYEFIPMDQFDGVNSETVSIEDVQIGKNYALVISTNGGLWRYIIGDTVTFTNTAPYRIKVTGRTTHFINAFGEELIEDNANSAIAQTCQKLNCKVKEFTAFPVHMDAEAKGGRHHWLVELEEGNPILETFTTTLDEQLKQVNSDYEAKRSNNLSLNLPKVTFLQKGTFYAWLQEKNKLGGQNKIPRLQNDDKMGMDILNLGNKH